MKKLFSQELAYVLGIPALAFGTALMERADFGMSMVVAPAYLVHLKLSQFFPWFTFGVAEYCCQALLLVILSLVLRQFKLQFLFSFITAFVYGTVLDVMIRVVSFIPGNAFAGRILFFLVGMLFCSLGVSFLFHTYIAPEAYELFVKEISAKYNKNINVVKTVYDCSSCVFAVFLSFAFMGLWHFEGVKIGTLICALTNGFIIGRISKFMESHYDFPRFFNKASSRN